MDIKTKFIPLDYEAFDFSSKNYILIYGRDEKGKRVCLVDKFESYLWAILDSIDDKEIEKLRKKIEKIEIKGERRTSRVEKVELHDKKFLSKDVKALKIFVTNYKDSHDVANELALPGIIARREYDINIITKYIIDSGLLPLSFYEVEGELLNNSLEFGAIDAGLDVDKVVKVRKFKKLEESTFSPRVLAFDIEADEFELGKGEIVMISLAGENFKKVLTWKQAKARQDFVECYKDEAEMLEKFVEYVKKQEPDFLVGYFSDAFDLAYLRARAEKLGVRLSLGLDNSQPSFTRGQLPVGRISGIVHVDLYKFIEVNYSQYLQSETLGLNEVSQELLGEGKRDFEFKKSKHIKDDEWKSYFDYNLQDSLLVYKLFRKFWIDLFEMTKIIQEPVFNVSRDRMSGHVEDFILHNLKRFNEIAEKRPIHDEINKRRMRERYEGAFVFQPIPGLYEDLAAFDFTSMYGSIINSFNLSLASFEAGKERESDLWEVDTGKERYYFSKKASFFPTLLGELIERRKQLKKQLSEKPDAVIKARSNAAKLLVNASYGYLGFFGARYYCPEAAASTTALVRKFIHESIDKTNKQGYKVVYGDTDGYHFLMNNKKKDETLEFLKKLNNNLPGMMELEIEDFYKRGIWVTKRTGEFGAKKKYALIDEKNRMKIRGFETVRRDWCNLARSLQSKILEMILIDGNEKRALAYFKKIVEDLKARKIERKDILIKTQLKKPLSDYKAITPHVIAAQKIKERGEPLDIGMLLEFFIAETREKKALVREKVKLPDEKGEYNLDYYLNNQLIPAVENIFEVFNVNIKEIIDGKKQKKLLEF